MSEYTTLTKFGVPSPDGAQRYGQRQPKIKHRFRVSFIEFGALNADNPLELTGNVVSADRPTVNFNHVEVQSYNSRMYYAGKAEWNSINITVRDDITNKSSRLIGQQVQKQMNFFEQTTFAAGVNYKFQTILEILDGGNQRVFEQWWLVGCFLETVAYQNLEYSSSDPVDIQLTIRFDNATLTSPTEDIFPTLVLPTAAGNGISTTIR